ncbi:MAG: anti-sigma factor [Acidobacteriota bacterium]
MNDRCAFYRDLIPRALLGDLESGRVAELDEHLAGCAQCRAERDHYRETVEQLALVEDEPVPRHFLVPADARHASWRDLLAAIAWPWRIAAATGLVVVFVLAGLGLSGLQFRAGDGVYAFSFGRPLPDFDSTARTEAAIQALRTETRNLVEQTIRSERQHYMDTLRAELARSSRRLNSEQRQLLQVALNDIENRLNQRIAATRAAIADQTDTSLDTLYATLQAQRTQDLAVIRKSITETARASEANDRQTQEVLATLLEVADLQIRRGMN